MRLGLPLALGNSLGDLTIFLTEKMGVPTRKPTYRDTEKTQEIASNLKLAQGQYQMLGATAFVCDSEP